LLKKAKVFFSYFALEKARIYLGMLALAIHSRSMLTANTGSCLQFGCGAWLGLPFVKSTSMINCKLVSHLWTN